ncbi:MAG: chorismate synthase [Blautia sp.]|nr:chorismate synthase [Blautia sp.]
MGGSSFGKQFCVTTWGESHGKAIGVVVDGCPAGLPLTEEDIQVYLDRRKPGQSQFTTARKESDRAQILSGTFEGRTTGTPISILIPNEDQRSRDYSKIAEVYRPGHADFGFDEKYGFRDYRGGGRSSGRETAARVAAGAIAAKLLSEVGIEVCAYTKAIGGIWAAEVDLKEAKNNALYMPDAKAAEAAKEYLATCMQEKDSAGGVVEVIAEGLPTGLGSPVFDKLDARLAQALMSIGAVKAVEVGDGIAVSAMKGSQDNDGFFSTRITDREEEDIKIIKTSNHSGGILGGISDGGELKLRVYIKPTPSIARPQETVNRKGENVSLIIEGRHDPVIVPRAVVVAECMCALVLADALLENMTSRMDAVKEFYWKKK